MKRAPDARGLFPSKDFQIQTLAISNSDTQPRIKTHLARSVVATAAGKCNKRWFGRGRSSARLERRPVTSEVVGSNPIGPAKICIWPAVHDRYEIAATGETKLRLTHQTKSISFESALRDRRWMIIDADGRALGRVAT